MKYEIFRLAALAAVALTLSACGQAGDGGDAAAFLDDSGKHDVENQDRNSRARSTTARQAVIPMGKVPFRLRK